MTILSICQFFNDLAYQAALKEEISDLAALYSLDGTGETPVPPYLTSIMAT
jgi:hypothetical protein